MAVSRHSGSADSKEYEDYIREINDIEQGKEPSDPEDPGTDDELSKTPDEGEQELAWLKDAGYGHLASKIQEGNELEEDVLKHETSSLTRAQAAAVKKRVDTLNATVRKKQKQQHKTDVRDVFAKPETDSSNSSSSSSQHLSSGDQSGILRPRKGSKKEREVSLLSKNRGGYYMTGDATMDDTTVTGVQMISIHSKGIAGSQGAQQKHTSETDCSLPSFILDTPTKNFVLQKDVLGNTRVCDLSKSDLVKIRALAFLEVTALFDTHNINYTRRKGKRRQKDHGVYGVPLQTILDHDQKKYPELGVPRIFYELIQFLEKCGIEEEGILRVPGSQTRIKALRQEIEEKYNQNRFSWEDVRPNDAAGLLKQFIRELPVPLLTFEYLEAFAAVEGMSSQDRDLQLRALNLLILCLPDVHRETLKMLLQFLEHVVVHEGNKMNLINVAMIMAPNLFLVASGRSRSKAKTSQDIELRLAAGTANIVRMLIKYQELLWTVPSFMVQQIRHQYETEQMKKSRDKSIMKLLGRKDKSEAYRKPAILSEKDYKEGVIKVQAPHLTKFPTRIQLQPDTVAKDIIQTFKKRTLDYYSQDKLANGRRGSHGEDLGVTTKGSRETMDQIDNMHLYETGGNIGERRLDSHTNMLALLNVNPNADWIVRI